MLARQPLGHNRSARRLGFAELRARNTLHHSQTPTGSSRLLHWKQGNSPQNCFRISKFSLHLEFEHNLTYSAKLALRADFLFLLTNNSVPERKHDSGKTGHLLAELVFGILKAARGIKDLGLLASGTAVKGGLVAI